MLQALRWSSTHRALRLAGRAWFGLHGRADNNRPIDLGQVERVLVVRLDEIGDVVLTTPFLRELRRNLPDASITLLVRPAIANLVEFCPYVNEVLTFEPAASPYGRALRASARALLLARKHLWRRNYDLAITPRWDVDLRYGTMAAFLSGAHQRLGYSERVTEEKGLLNAGLDRLLTHAVDGGTFRHEVEKSLDLIGLMGGSVKNDRLELWCGRTDELFADRILREHGAKAGEKVFAIAPGAGHAKRMWPLSRFVELSSWLQTNFGGTLAVIGSGGDQQLGKELERRLGGKVMNAVGASLRETGALLKRCHLFVGNDAGPMHLAAAAGLPVIEISCHPSSGSTSHANSPARFGPWRVPHVILRPAMALEPCSDACDSRLAHCIQAVSVEQVKEAAASLLARPDPVRP